MGKLLSGRYGASPDAESMTLSLSECSQKLNMKPSDFVSVGPPKFFEKNYGTAGRYLLFQAEPSDIKESAVWKAGFWPPLRNIRGAPWDRREYFLLNGRKNRRLRSLSRIRPCGGDGTLSRSFLNAFARICSFDFIRLGGFGVVGKFDFAA